MRWSSLAGSGLVLGLALLGSPAPAPAFWPLTRGGAASPDTLTQESLRKRFVTWKGQPLGGSKADTASTRAASVAPASKDSTAATPGLDAASLARAAAKAYGAGGDTAAAAPVAGADSTASATGAGAAGGDTTAVKKKNAPRGGRWTPTSAAADNGFEPKLQSTLRSTNDAMNLSTTMSGDFTDLSGATLSSSVKYGEDISLTQNTDQKTRGITTSLGMPLRSQGLDLNLSTSNSKLQRVGGVSLNGARTTNNSSNRGATAKIVLARELLRGVGANSFYGRDFAQNQQNVVATQGTGTGRREHQGSGQGYGVGVRFDRLKWMSLRARLGHDWTANVDRSPSLATATNPEGRMESPSKGDTASVDATLPVGGWLTRLNVSFRRAHSEESYTDVAQVNGSPGAKLGDYALETRRNFSRSLQVDGAIKPLSRVNINFTLQAGRDSVNYALRPNLFSDAQRRDATLNGSLNYGKENTLTVNYESHRSDVNQDDPRTPPNALTRLEKDNKLYAELAQAFTGTFKVKAYGEIRLTQGFYAHAGPQGKGDRDELRTRLGFDLDGKISAKATGHVTAYLRTYDQAFIDPRRSSGTKNETEYVVRPGFSYKITERVNIDQSYGLSSKVLDEIFNPGRSTLNRNHFMRTQMNCTVTDRLALNGSYDYVLQDNGLYTRDSGSDLRTFSPEARTKRDGMGIGVRYEVLAGNKLVFTSNQDAVRERRTTFGGGTGPKTTITERGNLALGLDSQFEMGAFNLKCALRRNQSFNVALNRKVYYNVDSSLSYTF